MSDVDKGRDFKVGESLVTATLEYESATSGLNTRVPELTAWQFSIDRAQVVNLPPHSSTNRRPLDICKSSPSFRDCKAYTSIQNTKLGCLCKMRLANEYDIIVLLGRHGTEL